MRAGLLTTVAVAGSLAATAQAQQAPTEIVVTATRLATYRGDADFSHVDLGQADLADARSLDDVLKTQAQASLFRRNSSLSANPTVQGISLRAIGPSGAGRALVTVDGIPQNDPFGNWVIWAGIPETAIDHVHVLRGAGGGAYGAGALTGVIDLSLAPPQRARDYGRLEIGEGGNSREDIGVAAGDVALYASDRTLRGDVPVRAPQRGAADGPVTGQDTSVLLNAAAPLCKSTDCGALSLLAGGYDSRRNTGLAGATALSRGDQYSLSFTQQPHDGRLGYRLQAWHNDSNLSNTSVSVGAGRAAATLSNNQFATPAHGTGFNAAVRGDTAQIEWELGADGRDQTGESRETYSYVAGQPTRLRMSGGETALIGAYAQGAWLGGPWNLTGAVRLDRWTSSHGHRREITLASGATTLDLHMPEQSATIASGRVGLGYAFNSGVSLRAAAYTGFRPPSLNELYRPFRVGNDVTDANAVLRPEQLDGAELGIHVVRGRLTLDGDLFANSLRDPITNVTRGRGPGVFGTAGFVPAGGAYRQRQNLGRIDATGLETRGRWDLTSGFALTWSATITSAHVAKAYAYPALDGLRPAEAPPYDMTAGLEGTIKRVHLAADWVFEGRTFDDDLNTLPLRPSQKLVLAARYPVTRHLDLSLRLDNALNGAIAITHANDGTIGFDNRRYASIALTWRE
jgi:outer membrane receptor protein involved in Fe transport